MYFNFCAKSSLANLYDVLVLEEDVEQRRILFQPLEVDVSRILNPLQLRTLGIRSLKSIGYVQNCL